MNHRIISTILREIYETINESYKLFGVNQYVSPRTRELTKSEAKIRKVAYALKNAETWAVKFASEDMAKYVTRDSVLVPIPSSKGITSDNLILANAIAKLSGSSVADILTRSEAVESSSQRRRMGLRGINPDHHNMVATETLENATDVVFIDNVTTTGSTGIASIVALGKGRVLAYAKADEVI